MKENIMFPLTLENVSLKEQQCRVQIMAEKLGITNILDKRTYEISRGQSQRTAIARAMIHQPKLLLADEPTGHLDSKSAKDVLEMMEKINKEDGATMMLVTHDTFAARYCNRVIFIKYGMWYLELHKQDGRQVFFQEIMNVLSAFGGA